jgi:hypothetical protein
MVGTVVLFMKYGFWGLVEKVISIILKFLNLDKFFKDYIKAGAKISDANIAAGGFGGWSCAGLGGGLR